MIYLLHHDYDAFELCHALWAMRVTRRPPTQVTLSRRGQGCVCHLHKQSTGLFSPRPRGIACYTLIEGSSTAPKHARMRAHGVWRVQTVTSVTQEFESENCVVCATICKYMIICSFHHRPHCSSCWMSHLLRLGAIEVLELSQVLLICNRIPPSHSCRCELCSRYARMLTRTVYCELSGQLDWGSSPSSRDLASAAAAASATPATALRRGGGVPKSCSPKPCEEVQGHESLVRRRTDTLGVRCTRPAARATRQGLGHCTAPHP